MPDLQKENNGSVVTPETAQIVLADEFVVGDVDPRLFGSFIEHMGRCVYTGVYEPGHPTADEHGFRKDVADLVRELGVTTIRYPGGNYVSGHRWEDGVGPREERPRRLDLAWRSIETNEVGTDEMLAWLRRQKIAPMMAVNLGTRGVLAATELVEYCNVPSGTYWSDQRRANGQEQPHDVRLWCLGNEMDGPWQLGHTSATEYGQRAREAGKAMKIVDPSIELVVCGSSHQHMPTFGQWESDVLEEAYEVADYISMHAYYENKGDRSSYLASGEAKRGFIADVIATADAVGARKGSPRRIDISCDEWSVWTTSPVVDFSTRQPGIAQPLTETPYQGVDAVVVGDMLIAMLGRADRVRIGCSSLLVNVSAPIHTTPKGAAYRQAIFHPIALAARMTQGGTSLNAVVQSSSITTKEHGEVPAVAAAVVRQPEGDGYAVFVTNRSPRSTSTRIRLLGAEPLQVVESWTISADATGETPQELELTTAPTPFLDHRTLAFTFWHQLCAEKKALTANYCRV